MKDWQKEFSLILETATHEVEQFFQDVSEVIEEFVEQVQDELSTEIEVLLEELISPFVDSYLEQDNVMPDNFYNEEVDLLINPKIEPNTEHYSACIGCQHYHGRVYGGTVLVCGMHPYGWDDDNCPDWKLSVNGQ